MKFHMWSGARAQLLILAVVVLCGCGGGGGDSASSGSQVGRPPSSGVNAAPSLSGSPITSVLAGQAYTFQPAASDPDGDALTFSASNIPVWASFNTATGRLSGTPASADVATFANITITVSDGAANASIGPFAITVVAAGAGAATLSWIPPTQNSDGSALVNLVGYTIRYGRSSDDLSQSVSLDNPSINVYVVENLTSGAWYFAVSAVNAIGASSPLSNVGSKTIS